MTGMNIDVLLPSLQQRYDEGLTNSLIGEAELVTWADEHHQGRRAQVYDEFARYLVYAFYDKRLSFGFCDILMNNLFALQNTLNDGQSDPFWAVFLAFDAGEYHRKHDKSDDPVREHKVSAIAKIVGELQKNNTA